MDLLTAPKVKDLSKQNPAVREAEGVFICPICNFPHKNKERAEHCASRRVPKVPFRLGSQIVHKGSGAFYQVISHKIISVEVNGRLYHRHCYQVTAPSGEIVIVALTRDFVLSKEGEGK
ncbi:MAG: hypothetical protein M1150_04045 [Patescibacteria group bacterium]|nr:hypothetical protein [Patescibacteria group bacterium]